MQTFLFCFVSAFAAVVVLGCGRRHLKNNNPGATLPPKQNKARVIPLRRQKQNNKLKARLSGDLVIFHAGSLAVPLRGFRFVPEKISGHNHKGRGSGQP